MKGFAVLTFITYVHGHKCEPNKHENSDGCHLVTWLLIEIKHRHHKKMNIEMQSGMESFLQYGEKNQKRYRFNNLHVGELLILFQT